MLNKKFLLITTLITLSIITLSMNTYAMEMEVKTNAMSIEPGQYTYDVLAYILRLSCPPMDLRYNKKPSTNVKDKKNRIYTTQNLTTLVTAIINLRCVNQNFNYIITQNINMWLNINEKNRDALLIRSAQANIPYFIKTAITLKANPNFFHEPEGYTPLLYTTFACCYPACKFLLEHGADVNLKMKEPSAYGYGYNPSCNWPIHVAVKSGDYKLVALFIHNKAILNIQINNNQLDSLLSIAAGKDNYDTLLALLLNIDPSIAHWKSDQIDHAWNTISNKRTFNYEELNKQTQCIDLLRQAKLANLKTK